jgi:tetratricopeptide (TPR) repeat protein
MRSTIFIPVLLAFILLSAGSSSASSFEDFNKCVQDRNFKKAKAVLDSWGKDKENDPQYYICLFNYHIKKSRTEGIGMRKTPPKDQSFEITEPRTKKVVGYLGPMETYDEGEAQKGIDHLKVGIDKFPDHYEMRFGLMYAYRELNQFDKYFTEMEKGLRYLQDKRPKKIYWNNNEIIKKPSKFVVEMTQRSFSELTGEEKYQFDAKRAHRYCDLMIQYFPNHKYGYSNKGVVYYQNKDFKHALDYFLKAYSLDPKDDLIAFNLGYLYKDMKDKNNARVYFKRVLEISKDESFTEGAKEQLKLLEKK